jgi:hypothetical protein
LIESNASADGQLINNRIIYRRESEGFPPASSHLVITFRSAPGKFRLKAISFAFGLNRFRVSWRNQNFLSSAIPAMLN